MKGSKFYFLVCLVLSGCGSVKDQSVEAVHQEHLDAYVYDVVVGDVMPFHGYVNFDEYKNPNSGQGVLYSGYNAGTFLASVLTHAAISKGADSSKMKKFIDESNKEAISYCAPVLSYISPEVFEGEFFSMYRGSEEELLPIERVLPDNHIPKGFLYSVPKFVLTKEKNTVIIENELKISQHKLAEKTISSKKKKTAKNKSKLVYSNTFVYVSDKQTSLDDEADEVAKNKQCSMLKALAVESYYNTMVLASGHITKKQSTEDKHETIRYYLGDHLRIERGKVVEKSCGRVVFESLRGWIKSVPQDQSDCDA